MAKKGFATKQPAEPIKDSVDRLYFVMYGLVIVLFIGFAAMFVAVGQMLYASWTEKQATYQSLRDEVKSQNAKIDTLTKALQSK